MRITVLSRLLTAYSGNRLGDPEAEQDQTPIITQIPRTQELAGSLGPIWNLSLLTEPNAKQQTLTEPLLCACSSRGMWNPESRSLPLSSSGSNVGVKDTPPHKKMAQSSEKDVEEGDGGG